MVRDRNDVRVGKMTDAQAIHALFDRLAQAWNHGSGSDFGAVFTEDADYVTFDGTHLSGRQSIADAHQRLFDTVLRESRLEGSLTDLRFLTPEIAVAHGRGAVRLRWQSRTPAARQSINTYVAVRHDGEWLFAAFQNTRIRRQLRLLSSLARLFQR